MNYDFIAFSNSKIPQAIDLVFQHPVNSSVSEANKTVCKCIAVAEDPLDFKPNKKRKPIRTILVLQLLSVQRSSGSFVGTLEPPIEQFMPSGEKPGVQAHIDK